MIIQYIKGFEPIPETKFVWQGISANLLVFEFKLLELSNPFPFSLSIHFAHMTAKNSQRKVVKTNFV